jgi:hypothetical protein
MKVSFTLDLNGRFYADKKELLIDIRDALAQNLDVDPGSTQLQAHTEGGGKDHKGKHTETIQVGSSGDNRIT